MSLNTATITQESLDQQFGFTPPSILRVDQFGIRFWKLNTASRPSATLPSTGSGQAGQVGKLDAGSRIQDTGVRRFGELDSGFWILARLWRAGCSILDTGFWMFGPTGKQAHPTTRFPRSGKAGQRANRQTGQPANGQTGKRAHGQTGQRANGQALRQAQDKQDRQIYPVKYDLRSFVKFILNNLTGQTWAAHTKENNHATV